MSSYFMIQRNTEHHRKWVTSDLTRYQDKTEALEEAERRANLWMDELFFRVVKIKEEVVTPVTKKSQAMIKLCLAIFFITTMLMLCSSIL